MANVGERIKKARKAVGLTQLELAKKISMSQSYIADMERNRHNPSLAALQLIADALHVDIAEFVGDSTIVQETGLANDEIHLVMMYRNMSADDKSLIMQMSQRCSKKNVKSTPLMNYNTSKIKVNTVGLAGGRG